MLCILEHWLMANVLSYASYDDNNAELRSNEAVTC